MRRFGRMGVRRAALGAALVLTGIVAAVAGRRGGDPGSEAERGAATSEARSGVSVLGVRLSASGYMLDLRYRVVDPETSSGALGPGIEPRLIVEKSGATLEVPSAPKIGRLRAARRSTSGAQRDSTYFALFANPGRLVAAGDEVTLIMGDLAVPHIRVE